MNKTAIYFTILLLVAGGIIAAYVYRHYNQPTPQLTQEPAPLPAPPKPEVRQEIVPPPEEPPLPRLANSDSFMLDSLTSLIGDKNLVSLLNTKNILRNIVATVDNLPRRKISKNVLPIKQAAGKFVTEGKDDILVIGPANAERYTPYVQLAETVDTKVLVELYVRLYPLFQQAYVELGYPKKYFNDRLMFVLDDLLDAPAPAEPVKLVKHMFIFQYADPGIEELSIGQRTMVRMGNANQARIKAKLQAFKSELQLHLHEKVVQSAE